MKVQSEGTAPSKAPLSLLHPQEWEPGLSEIICHLTIISQFFAFSENRLPLWEQGLFSCILMIFHHETKHINLVA